ncbi:MAG: glycosyltransferase family 4 protein [Bacteroidota bacterium]|nr:glycosyltransferase family 4 protein [Bacteroidota bacterium]
MRLAIITTHPIQYYAPVFKLLAQRQKLEIRVFYTWGEAAANKFDPGFNKTIEWDIPLLDGYPYEWVKNTSSDPGTHHFKGIVNPGLIGQVNLWRPDAVLVFGWGFQSHLKALRYFKNKIPVFFRGDSTLLDEKRGMKSLRRSLILKWVYRYVDHAFYVGTNNKAYFLKYGLKEKQLSFAPHAIDNDRFGIDRHNEARELRRQLGIADDEVLVMFAGKLEEKKSPLLLLRAFININNPKTHLLYVGNGPLEADLKQKATGNSNVNFFEFQNQSQIPAVYQACDLFCLPSQGPNETWGLAINEAMACGKAILASDVVGCAIDLVKDNENGAIFKAGDLNNLTEKLNLLVRNKEQLSKMGEQSKLIIKDWSFLHIAEAIENKLLNEA